MGRVARYKKIKACDPFSRKNRGKINHDTIGVWGLGDNGRRSRKRSRTAENLRAKRKRTSVDDFDAPPEADDFDMADLVGSLKKEKVPVVAPIQPAAKAERVSTNLPAPLPEDKEEKEAKRLLKLDQQVDQKKEKYVPGRMEGESKNAFRKRVKVETREIIKETKSQRTVTTEKRQRKKEFLNNKKKRKKGGSGMEDASDDETSDHVAFGEQAERPPIFRQVPRGATKKEKKTSDATGKKRSQEDIEAEQRNMEAIRMKVQAQYAEVRRNRGSGFHL